ncbi:TPA: hypothetical protein ACOTG0_002128 [Clostridium perfringens]|nr:hypothetical protein phiCPD_00041 [Clostridium phage phiCp-D]
MKKMNIDMFLNSVYLTNESESVLAAEVFKDDKKEMLKISIEECLNKFMTKIFSDFDIENMTEEQLESYNKFYYESGEIVLKLLDERLHC